MKQSLLFFTLASLGSACSAGPPSNDNGVTLGAAGQGGASNVYGGQAPVAGAGSGNAGMPPLASTGGAGGAGGASAGGAAGAPGGASGSAGAAGTAAAGSSSQSDPGGEGDGVRPLSPPYHDAPEYSRGDGVPRGKIVRFTVTSSTIYPKTADREIAVYVPAQYQPGTPAPVMVFQDGTDFFGFDDSVPTVLDNLIAQGKIPALVGVFAGNGGGDYIGSERGLEYDTVSGVYAEWVDQELLPRAERETSQQLPEQAVTFTKDPEGRAALGGSSGGAASFSMAWWRSDLFRKVIAFSGTFVNQVPANSPFPHGAWVYHDIDPYDAGHANGLIAAHCESQLETAPSSQVKVCDTPLSESKCVAVQGCRWNTARNKPVRAWLEAGSGDLGAGDGPGSYRNFHLANQRMADALGRRGYHFHFDDCADAGHVDGRVVRQTLPEALTWLWRGYHPEQ